jgi:hypothetical protein
MSAASQAQAGGDPERIVSVIRDRLGEALEERLVEGIKDRLREVVEEGFEDAARERLREAIRSTVAERLASIRSGSGGQRQFALGGRFGGQGVGHPGPMVELLRERIAEQVRDRLAEAIRERVGIAVRHRLEDALSERLGGAIRAAFAEQSSLGVGFDPEQIAESIRFHLTDAIREDLVEAIRGRVREALRDRLGDAIRNAVAEGGMSPGEQPPYVH